MKQIARSVIVAILEWQVRRLYKKHSFKTVVVAGSIGKTSTKFALTSVLGQRYRVRYQAGNYNVPVTVPLVFFNLPLPSLFNPVAWLVTFLKIEAQLHRPLAYDVVVIELGTDAPGDIAAFGSYIKADVGVLTAITPEHMEFFKDLDAVAREELGIAQFSRQLLVNADLCAPHYLKGLHPVTYGMHKQATYHLKDIKQEKGALAFTVHKNGKPFLRERHASVADTQIITITASAAVGDMLGLRADDIRQGIESIQPVSGRMQPLSGIKNSLILDDTYNASPEAAKAALDTLYRQPAPQRIAILGSMNELGEYSPEAHQEVGAYCDPKQLDFVVTIGADANTYLAPAARQKDCTVHTFDDPYTAGAFVHEHLKDGAVLLAKGSQNGVFAEEAIKQLLADPKDADKLVRQSSRWLARKHKQFGKRA